MLSHIETAAVFGNQILCCKLFNNQTFRHKHIVKTYFTIFQKYSCPYIFQSRISLGAKNLIHQNTKKYLHDQG